MNRYNVELADTRLAPDSGATAYAKARRHSLASLEQQPHGDDFILPRAEIAVGGVNEALVWGAVSMFHVATMLALVALSLLVVWMALIECSRPFLFQ
jgi:hypothetical protein